MATLPDAAFDLAIVDPPYGRGEDGGTNRCHGVKQKNGTVLQCLDGRPATVCDPYMGTGATGVAAVNLGLHFIGIEIHGQYFEEACRRIEQAYAQPRLFEDAKVGAGETAAQGDLLLPANDRGQGGAACGASPGPTGYTSMDEDAR